MTREEAIEHGKEQLEIFGGEHKEFIELAIKALEQEPTTKNDLGVDLISREAVLEQAYAYGNGLEPDGYCVNVEDIQALPSVTPQEPCDKCEVGNPCLYCKHEFEPQESEGKE